MITHDQVDWTVHGGDKIFKIFLILQRNEDLFWDNVIKYFKLFLLFLIQEKIVDWEQKTEWKNSKNLKNWKVKENKK